MTSMFMYGFIIRVFVENFMAIFISCILNFKEAQRSSYGEITSFIYSIGLIISMFLIFGIVTYRTIRNRNNLNEDHLKNEIGSFYEDLRLDGSLGVILYTPIYIVRRLIFCILIIVIPD